MYNDKKIAAIIPAKGTSKRVKNKNLQDINNETLVGRKIKQLMRSKLIDEVFVGSDSNEILELSKTNGAIPILREAYFCNEELASANEMIADLVSRVESDIIVWAHCTNPFVDEDIYDKAIIEFFENKNSYDSLVSVTSIRNHFWYKGEPLNFNPNSKRHPFASELETLFYQNGAIFIQSKDSFVSNSYFYGKLPYLFQIPEKLAFDINTEEEMDLARHLAVNYK